MVKKIGAVLAGLSMLLLMGIGTASTASATDNATYYIGSTWNPWTNDWPSSYAPSGSNKGVARIDHGGSYRVFQSGATQYSQLLGGSGASGNSTKMTWYPCNGTNFMRPCYSSGGTLALKEVVLQDRYGVVATAVPSSGHTRPLIFAEEAYNDQTGIDNSFRPHITSLGNVDYVSQRNGYSPVPFTTTHVSGTGGFTTAIPLSWSPKLCWNFQAVDAYQAGGPYHFYICHSLVPHRL